MVLSQLRTFTVLRVISSTLPFALPSGICIQSPIFIISFCDSCTPATKPRMLSLNISINIAADAPRPVSSTFGDLSIATATIMMPPTKYNMTCSPWMSPCTGWFRCLPVLVYTSRNENSREFIIIIAIIIR